MEKIESYGGYVSPQCDVHDITPRAIICQSPKPGENEGIGYETW